MADNNESASLYKCQDCGIFFVTYPTAISHQCSAKGGSKANDQSTVCADNVEKTLFSCEDCSAWFADKKSYDQHVCVGHQSSSKSQLDQDEGNYNTQQGNCIVWTRPPTLRLIDEYAKYIHKFESGHMRKKDMWNHIQLKLKSEGYTFSLDQIAGRWKSLMRGHKNIKDHNHKSGNGAKKHEYQDELDKLFQNDPVVSPDITRTSGKRAAKEVEGPGPSSSTSSSSTTDMDRDACILNQDDNFYEQSSEAANKKCKRSTGSAKEMVTLMKSFMEDRKKKEEQEVARREQMHRERISVMNNLITAITGKSTPASGNDDN